MSREAQRRMGDAIAIPGDYQHRALTDGPAFQRAWHGTKLALLDWLFVVEPGERVLDVGCGSGVLAERMARRGAHVLGIDANPAAVAYATATFAREGLSFAHGYLDELELAPSSFDALTCIEVIEHVTMPQVEALLADARRVLRPGGRMLLTTPNYRGLWPLIEWLADRSGSTAHMDADQHITRFHRGRLRTALSGAGLEVQRLCTFSTFAPFLAPLSARLGTWAESAERALDLPFGNILAAVVRRPS